MSDPAEFWADEGEVLLKKRDRELYHVAQRFWDVDHDSPDYPGMGRYYRLWDDTHTTDQYWIEEDVVDCFEKIGVVVNGKPRQAEDLRYWYE